MRDVSVADLKNELGTYLDFAKAGEVVVIHDGDMPIAQLIRFSADWADEEAELVAAGVLIKAKIPFHIDDFPELPESGLEGNAGTQAILDERNEGW